MIRVASPSFRALAAAIFCAMSAGVWAGAPVGYYDTANTASSAQLRSSLNDIVTAGFSQVGYSNTNAALFVTDQDPNNSNNVLMIYGRDSRPKSAASGSSDGNAATGGWNREHSFPQSFFNEREPMRSDLHALFPCDVDINSRRSNYPYDMVPTATYTDVFGNRGTSSRFEPANVDKGRVSRGILYMDIRYEGEGGNPNLTVINSAPGGTGAGQMAYLNTMLDWHRQYPPTAFERARNQRVYNRQGNANPFVDRPEWVSLIYGGTAWTMTNNDTLTVGGVNRTPLSSQSAGAQNVPLLSLNLGLAANQFHINTLAVQKLGTIDDTEVSAVKLWWDVDNNGIATTADTLLDTRSFSGAAATFTLSHPFYVAPGQTNLLITGSLAGSIAGSRTFGVRATANGIAHDASGGNDVNPSFADIDSNLVTVGGSISNGDALSAVSFTNRTPYSAPAGTSNLPLLSVNLSLASGEWDLASIAVSEIGTSLDTDVSALRLYRDLGNDGTVNNGDPLLASATLSSGAATFSLSPPFRITPGTVNLLVAADIAPAATADRLLQLQVNASGILHSPTGGADINPANSAFQGTAAVITSTVGGEELVDLIITEVFEGSSGNLKYVEIHNPTMSAISLATPNDYKLRQYVNGGSSPTVINLTGTVPAGGFYVVVNNSTDFDPVFGAAARDQISGSVTHNGNDNYDLYNATTANVVDYFAGDLVGSNVNFAMDVCAMRIIDELPNNGAWGGAVQPAANANSPSGFWATRRVLSGNSNATLIGNPGILDVPVGLSSFSID